MMKPEGTHGSRFPLWSLIITIIVILTAWTCLLSVIYRKVDVNCSVVIPPKDKNKPLVLTSYLESGETAKAQQLALVTHFNGEFESYSGYYTIDKLHGSNIFFWYFPAQLKRETAPVLLWLNGGPGSSSQFGLFVENGPLIVNETSVVELRRSSWTLTNSVLYLDSPVGTGFSYTESEAGYARNIKEITEGLYISLCQFFKMFPQLKKRDFYITGESYAGKYIPHLAYKVLQENFLLANANASEKTINLKGISIGNGFIDPEHSLNYSEFLFDLGILDFKTKKLAQSKQDQIRKLILEQKWVQALREYDNFIGYSGKMDNFISKKTGLKFYYNVLVSNRPPDYDYYKKFVDQPEIRDALHVGDHHFDNGDKVMSLLEGEIMQSAKQTLEFLLNNGIRILLYNGQLDMIVPNRLTDDFIKTLQWFGIKGFLETPRKIWKVSSNQDVAGYYTSYLNFTRLTVRNCGHMVPYDEPKWALEMIDAFTSGKFEK